MNIEISPSGRRHCLRFFRDGEIFHTDTINLHDDRQRQRVITTLVETHAVERTVAESQIVAAMRQLVAAETTQSSNGDQASTCPYDIREGGIWSRLTGQQIANFTAQIVEELCYDDGLEQLMYFVVEGNLSDGTALPRVKIPASEFAGMDWVGPHWGSRPIIAAGRNSRDQVRAAIQVYSDAEKHTLWGHLGWQEIDEQMVFLHAGGGIGATGQIVGIEVNVPTSLERFVLPEPPAGQQLYDAVQACLRFLDLAPDRISVPIFGAIWRAPLGNTDFGIHVVARSGLYKTSICAVAQQHSGAGMDATHIPANWSSTGNSLEGLAFIAKDSLLVVDDFCPVGSPNQVQSYHREADRLFRAQGNCAGRQRMRADGSLRPAKPPRGLILSTGEESPRGESLGARIMAVDVQPGDVSVETLTVMQRYGAQGVLSGAMSAFMQWVASRYSELQEQIRRIHPEIRDEFRRDRVHARTPGIAAQLIIGIQCFLDFALDSGCIDDTTVADIERRCWAALRNVVGEQQSTQSSTDPVQQFLAHISSLLATGQAHLEPLDHHRPESLRHYGWRSSSASQWGPLEPGGPKIGWLMNDDVYLEPTAAYAAVQRVGRDTTESISISKRMLIRRMRDADLLVVEPSQETHLHRLPSPHRDMRALRLRAGVLPNQLPSCINTTDTDDERAAEADNHARPASCPQGGTRPA